MYNFSAVFAPSINLFPGKRFTPEISFPCSSGRMTSLHRGGEMNDVLNSGAFSLASLIVSMVVLVVGLALWFFVNRASSRANEQIELLEALLDQQKRQNALLRRLCEANEPEKKRNPQQRQANRKRMRTSFVWLLNDNAYRGANGASAIRPISPSDLSALPFATDTTASTPYLIYGFICNIVLYV